MAGEQEAADAAYTYYKSLYDGYASLAAAGADSTQMIQQYYALMDAEAASLSANDALRATYNQPQTSSSSSPVYYGSAPAPQAIPPNPWNTTVTYTAPVGIKQADPDIITFDDEVVSGTFLVERFFEEIGGIELINISRSDIINGDLVNYTPIKNLSSLRRQYNPNNIIAIASTAQSAFSRFKIDLILRGINEPYLDDDGNLVIEIDLIDEDEFIEAEIATSGTINRIEL